MAAHFQMLYEADAIHTSECLGDTKLALLNEYVSESAKIHPLVKTKIIQLSGARFAQCQSNIMVVFLDAFTNADDSAHEFISNDIAFERDEITPYSNASRRLVARRLMDGIKEVERHASEFGLKLVLPSQCGTAARVRVANANRPKETQV